MDSLSLRENFINYFRDNEHRFLAPSKIFIDSDPTLLYVNSGMCQLKSTFLGIKEINEKFSKLVNWQICVRSSGKHNDFDDVGKDSYHLTSFTMLGNWSLDNYWKTDAIRLAFNYLIKLGLDRNRMYATYFEGNHIIPADLESKNEWTKYLDEDHIIPGNTKDNFWSMAETGPSGLSTEIHYDLIENRQKNVSDKVNKDDPTVVEIWNIVFMEYNAVKNEDNSITYESLDKHFVDTGMGLERLSMIIQNKLSIYQTDNFQKIFSYIHILSNADYYTDLYNGNKKDIAYRIFADHIRTCVIILYDGVEFSGTGRGFILKKIFRRLLFNYYIHLNNKVIKPVTKHHLMNALITEILLFYLFKKHDSEKIRKQMEAEEMLYIGKLNKIKMLYGTIMEKYNSETDNDESVKEILINKVKKTARGSAYGIDDEFIDFIPDLVFSL
jgi:alanyl-tRNA synthetase